MAEDASKGGVVDIPTKERSASKQVKYEAEVRRGELIGVISIEGFRNVKKNLKAWAEHYKVHERTIYRDFDWIKGNWKPFDLREVKITLGIARDQALNQALKILADINSDKELKLKAISAVIAAGKYYREELEAWGEKEKVADRQSIAFETIFTKEEREAEIKRLTGK